MMTHNQLCHLCIQRRHNIVDQVARNGRRNGRYVGQSIDTARRRQLRTGKTWLVAATGQRFAVGGIVLGNGLTVIVDVVRLDVMWGGGGGGRGGGIAVGRRCCSVKVVHVVGGGGRHQFSVDLVLRFLRNAIRTDCALSFQFGGSGRGCRTWEVGRQPEFIDLAVPIVVDQNVVVERHGIGGFGGGCYGG